LQGLRTEITIDIAGGMAKVTDGLGPSEFALGGKSFRFVNHWGYLESEGKRVARFRGRWSSILADGYPPELETIIGVLATALVLEGQKALPIPS